jgi:hypothetical protein
MDPTPSAQFVRIDPLPSYGRLIRAKRKQAREKTPGFKSAMIENATKFCDVK